MNPREEIRAYIATLVSADMMRVQTGYPMSEKHRLAVGAFRRFEKDRQLAIIEKLAGSADDIISDKFDTMVGRILSSKEGG